MAPTTLSARPTTPIAAETATTAVAMVANVGAAIAAAVSTAAVVKTGILRLLQKSRIQFQVRDLNRPVAHPLVDLREPLPVRAEEMHQPEVVRPMAIAPGLELLHQLKRPGALPMLRVH